MVRLYKLVGPGRAFVPATDADIQAAAAPPSQNDLIAQAQQNAKQSVVNLQIPNAVQAFLVSAGAPTDLATLKAAADADIALAQQAKQALASTIAAINAGTITTISGVNTSVASVGQ